MGGYGSKQINYEGYGKTKKEAVSVLDALLRYHHSNIRVYVAKDPTSVPPLKPRYYVLDGRGKHIPSCLINRGNGFELTSGSIDFFSEV